MISKEAFLEAFLEIYHRLDWHGEETEAAGYHPTYFEYLFFIAMLVFQKDRPDFCILETGVGGRLDATNSVFQKELSVITRIGLDHVQYLGDTVEKIAFEKAGIMQQGAPAVYWNTSPQAEAVFRQRAENLGISAYSVSENDYSFSNFKRKSIDFCVRTEYYKYITLTLNTIAAYQRENCTLAIRAAEILDGGKTITEEQIKAGVRNFSWAGRMEEVLPEVYVDGAHNGDGIRAFLETVAEDGCEGRRILCFSVVKDKDYEHMAEMLRESGLFRRAAVVGMRGERALSAERLKGLFAGWSSPEPKVYDHVEDALYGLLQERQGEERIYVVGSLYLVGEIKELLENDKFRRRIKEIPSQS